METQDIKPDLMVRARHIERAGGLGHGLHLGKVELLLGGFIQLRADGAPDGRRHWIPLAWVEDVDDKAVYLNKTSEEVEREMLDAIPTALH